VLLILDIAILPAVPDIVTSSMPVKLPVNLTAVPVGAVVVKDDQIIGKGYNQVIAHNSVTSHAEINAINDASQNTNNYRLNDCNIFVTLEPCHMCAKAIIDARIRKVCFGAKEPKTGALVSIDNFFEKPYLNHKVELTSSILQKESSAILKKFFVV
jgi:tRNA(adenine34) deaminase